MPQPPADTTPLLICGPTASGKSGLAMRLAEALNGEIVGADSVQVYRRLDIGSAKPTPQDRARVPHHLVDCVPLDTPYDAGDYVQDAERVIADVQARGKRPILCGGTGMYLRALIYGLVEAAPTDPALRAQLQARARAEGDAALHAALAAVDPKTAARVHPNDRVRVVRALEVFMLTGRTMSDVQSDHDVRRQPPRFPIWQAALGRPREALYARINARVDAMFAEGWLDEVQHILDDGFSPDLKPLGSLGYRHLVAFLQGGDASTQHKAAVIERIKRDHRRYAKRQLTWFRAQPHLSWFETPDAAFEAAMTLHHGPSQASP